MPFCCHFRTFGNIKVHLYGEEMLERFRLYLIQVEEMWEGAEGRLTDLSVMSTGFLNDINCPLQAEWGICCSASTFHNFPEVISFHPFVFCAGIALSLLTPDSHMQLQRPSTCVVLWTLNSCPSLLFSTYFVSQWFKSLTSQCVHWPTASVSLACWKAEV